MAQLNNVRINRALYSLIQFTTITLLYSFASSLGDLQVSISCDYRQGGIERLASSCTLIYLSSSPLPLAVSLLSFDDKSW
jgi:hypothetical protein